MPFVGQRRGPFAGARGQATGGHRGHLGLPDRSQHGGGAGEFQAALESLRDQLHPGRRDRRAVVRWGCCTCWATASISRTRPCSPCCSTVRQPWRTSMRLWLDADPRVFGRAQRPAGLACLPDGTDAAATRPLTTAMAICLIHEAGGQGFPGPSAREPAERSRGSRKRSTCCRRKGWTDIEVFHKSYPEGVQAALLALATRRGLVPTGGSDFHGLDHSDGASLGVDVPVEHWAQIVRSGRQRSEPVPFPASVRQKQHLRRESWTSSSQKPSRGAVSSCA